jgi:hypothetical protein
MGGPDLAFQLFSGLKRQKVARPNSTRRSRAGHLHPKRRSCWIPTDIFQLLRIYEEEHDPILQGVPDLVLGQQALSRHLSSDRCPRLHVCMK